MIQQTLPSKSNSAPNRRQPGYAPNPSPAIGEPPRASHQRRPSMSASFSSGSSFTSSSHSRLQAYSRSYTSPVDSTWTPTSGVSTASAPSTGGSMVRQSSLQTLDIGAPGFQATITLYPESSEERTVYLGPWKIIEGEQRRIIWQCSYENEILEHYLPSPDPAESFPHSRHSKHRKYHDPSDMERHLTFTLPNRIRYTTDEGTCIHDQYVTVNYEFTTVSSAIQFQSDVRDRQMVAFFDLNLAWTNVHDLKNSYGHVTGIAAVQRLKLWRDHHNSLHYITIYAKKIDGYREYSIISFDSEIRKDDKKRQVQLNVAGRRRSAPDSTSSSTKRRLSLPKLKRPFTTPSHTPDQSSSSSAHSTPVTSTLNIRFLSLEFSDYHSYRRFIDHWAEAHAADSESHSTPASFSQTNYQLSSATDTQEGSAADATNQPRRLEAVQEPPDPNQR